MESDLLLPLHLPQNFSNMSKDSNFIRQQFFIQQKTASIQILEAVLYKQQGRSDKPRPCKLLIIYRYLSQNVVLR